MVLMNNGIGFKESFLLMRSNKVVKRIQMLTKATIKSTNCKHPDGTK